MSDPRMLATEREKQQRADAYVKERDGALARVIEDAFHAAGAIYDYPTPERFRELLNARGLSVVLGVYP